MRYQCSPARRVTVIGALLLAIGLPACGSSGSSGGSNSAGAPSDAAASTTGASKAITMSETPYNGPEAALATAILTKAGYSVKTQHVGSIGLAYQTTAAGSADFYVDAWLPHTQASYWSQYGSKLSKLGKFYAEHVTTGLVVPKYCPGQSIPDLNKYSSTYGGQIIGTSAGAGETIETQHAVPAYGLKLRVVPASEDAEVASIRAAVANHKCVVVALWDPEPAWVTYPLRYLSDPKAEYPIDNGYTIGHKDFPSKFPAAAKFLADFTIHVADESQMVKLMSQGKSAEQAIQPWLASHAATVDKWVSLARG
jgi:glycine betaine/proline transport system substrate-binding protein